MIAETTALSLPPPLSPFSCSLLFLWVCYLWPALHKLFSAIMANTIQSVWSFPFNLISRTVSRTRHPSTTPLSPFLSTINHVRKDHSGTLFSWPPGRWADLELRDRPCSCCLMWLVTQSVVFVPWFTLTLTTEPSTCHWIICSLFICAASLFLFCVHLKFSYLSF